MAFGPLQDKPADQPPVGRPGWYEVALEDTTLLSLWWDGSHWSDDAGGNDQWSQNAVDSIRGWRLLWQPDKPSLASDKPDQR